MDSTFSYEDDSPLFIQPLCVCVCVCVCRGDGWCAIVESMEIYLLSKLWVVWYLLNSEVSYLFRP